LKPARVDGQRPLSNLTSVKPPIADSLQTLRGDRSVPLRTYAPQQGCNPNGSLLTFCVHLGFCRNGLQWRLATEDQLRRRREGTSTHE
jgi:hypothetical protein